jgi:hypothetical protein
MKLMVGEVLEVLTGVQKILQHYRGSKVTDMLDDIYRRCCVEADKAEEVTATFQPKPAARKTAKAKRELQSEEEFVQLKQELEQLERDKAEAVLNSFKIKELCAFADWSCISIQKTARKDVIIGQISNHFGFSHLNMKMGQRPDMVR